MLSKTIKAKIVNLTKTKEDKLNREYDNFQLWANDLDFLTDELYSATKQQAERLLKRLEYSRDVEYPLIIRRDCFNIEKHNTKISKYWCKVPVYKKSIWVAVEFPYNQQYLLKYSIREVKLTKKNGWFLLITVQKGIYTKNSYSSILAIDLGIRHIACSVNLLTKETHFYGRELRLVRGHYFHLRKKLATKKIKQYYKWINNNSEQRIVNDLLHKISRDIVNQALKTDSVIMVGNLKHIRKNSKGRKFNRKLNSFPFYKLVEYIRYKANWEGIKVVLVSEYYTSQICSKCENIGIRKNGLFACDCGYEDNADRNGAINIGKRALGQVSKAGVVLTQPRTKALNINNQNIKISVRP